MSNPVCIPIVLVGLALGSVIACSPASAPPPSSHIVAANPNGTSSPSPGVATSVAPPEPAGPPIRVQLRTGHPAGELAGIAVNSEGLVSAGPDGMVVAWDVTERISRASTTLAAELVGIAGSAKQKAVVLAAKDGRIFRWEPGGAAPKQIAKMDEPVTRIAASADLGVLVVAMAESVNVVDGQNGAILRNVPFRVEVHSVAITDDGERIAVGYGEGKLYAGLSRKKVELLDKRSEAHIGVGGGTEYSPYTSLRWDPSGERLAAFASTAEVWSLRKNQAIREMEYIHGARTQGKAVWSPDGGTLVFAPRMYTTWLYALSIGKNKATELHDHVEIASNFVDGIALVNEKLVAIAADGADIDLRHLPSLDRAGQLRSNDSRISGLAWDPKGDRLAWLSRNRRLLVLDTQKLEFSVDQNGYEFNTAHEELPMAFDTEGKWLFVPRFTTKPGDSNKGAIFEARTNQFVGRLDSNYSALGVASGARLLTTWRGQGPLVTTVQVQNGKVAYTRLVNLESDRGTTADTVIADDGSGRAMSFPAEPGGGKLLIFPENGDPTNVPLPGAALTAAIRGSTIVTGSKADPMQLLRWDDKGTALPSLKIDCPPKFMTISPDQRMLAVACKDDAGLRVLSIEGGRELLRDAEPMTAVAFHPSAPVLAAGGKTLRLFRMDRLGKEGDRLTIAYVDRKDNVYPVVIGNSAIDAADGAGPAMTIVEADSAAKPRTLADVRKPGLLSRFITGR